MPQGKQPSLPAPQPRKRLIYKPVSRPPHSIDFQGAEGEDQASWAAQNHLCTRLSHPLPAAPELLPCTDPVKPSRVKPPTPISKGTLCLAEMSSHITARGNLLTFRDVLLAAGSPGSHGPSPPEASEMEEGPEGAGLTATRLWPSAPGPEHTGHRPPASSPICCWQRLIFNAGWADARRW